MENKIGRKQNITLIILFGLLCLVFQVYTIRAQTATPANQTNNASDKDSEQILKKYDYNNAATLKKDIETFDKQYKAVISEYNGFKTDYEKKFADFQAFLKSSGDSINTSLACKSLVEIKTTSEQLEAVVKKVTDRIIDFQKTDDLPNYFGVEQLKELGALQDWFAKEYSPRRTYLLTISGKFGCSGAGSGQSSSSATAASGDAKERFNKYAAETQALGAAYRKSTEYFQQTLNRESKAANPNKAAVCAALSEMNVNFQKLKTSFSRIVEMKDKGDLSGQTELIKSVEDKAAENAQLQNRINGAAQEFGCKLN